MWVQFTKWVSLMSIKSWVFCFLESFLHNICYNYFVPTFFFNCISIFKKCWSIFILSITLVTEGAEFEETTTTEPTELSNKGYKKVPGNLRNEVIVNLSGNKITRLSQGDFDSIKNCRTLHLENNTIAVIESGTFKPLSQLKTLNLNKNPLREIKGDMWKGLRALVNISIRGLPTNITLHHQAFSNLPKLHKVDLDLKHLKKYSSFYVNSTNFPDTPKNQVKFRIELGGNEITCDNSFCFLNNMHKKGLIGGFTAKGSEFDQPVCKKDQTPFWKYASVNCDSIGKWNNYQIIKLLQYEALNFKRINCICLIWRNPYIFFFAGQNGKGLSKQGTFSSSPNYILIKMFCKYSLHFQNSTVLQQWI